MDRTASAYAKLLLLFWEEGIKPKKAGPILDMAHDVLSQWLKPRTKGLRAITAWSIVASTFEDYSFDDNAPPSTLRLGISTDSPGARYMENRLGKIEAETKGLGEAALYWLARASYRTIDVFTPAAARDVAEYLWWRGETDEKEWKASLLEEGYAEEDIEDMIGPAKFEAAFPSWVLKPKEPNLSRLKPKSDDGKKILSILREIEGCAGQEPLFPYRLPESFDRVYWAAYLGWRAEQCLVFRLLDDHFEMANQGGDYLTELSGVEVIPLDAEAFKQWKLRMERGFKVLNLLDQLILLTTEEW